VPHWIGYNNNSNTYGKAVEDQDGAWKQDSSSEIQPSPQIQSEK